MLSGDGRSKGTAGSLWASRRADRCDRLPYGEHARAVGNEVGAEPDSSAAFVSMGRMATLFHDTFDGSGLPQTAVAPNNGDHHVYSGFQPPATPGQPDEGVLPLLLASSGYNNTDAHLDRVAMPGTAIRRIAQHLATDLHRIDFGITSIPLPATVDEAKIYRAVNDTMAEAGLSWCERSRVLGLHPPTTPATIPSTVAELLLLGQSDPFLASVLGPPPADPRRLNAAALPGTLGHCQLCGPGLVTASDGTCVPGCPVDVFLDGTTVGGSPSVVELPFDTNASTPGDPCPETFILHIDSF